MKRRLVAIQRVLEKRQREVPASPLWLALHDEWAVGQRRGKKIALSLADRDVMRQQAIAQYGADPLALDFEKGRTEMAQDAGNEKLSRQRAFGRLLRVAVPGGGVTVMSPGAATDGGVVIPTPPGVLLSVEPDQLSLGLGIRRVLVIENADIMERWWELLPLLPAEWQADTMMVYRGHRQDARALREWIRTHEGSIELGFYGDYDPSGVHIGVSEFAPLVSNRFYLLAPADNTTIPVMANKPATFSDQEYVLPRLAKHASCSTGTAAGSLVAEVVSGRWAVTQEALLAHRIDLQALPVH